MENIFKLNQQVRYINLDGTTQIVKIIGIHLDTQPDIYYTIEYDKDKIKQTTHDRLLKIKEQAFYKINDKAKYYNYDDDTYEIVTIIDVHYEKLPVIYYTVKFNNGKIKTVECDNLFYVNC